MWLFGSLWFEWELAFKVVTPMLHVLFAAAQMWGSWVFFKMYRRQCRLLTASKDMESAAPDIAVALEMAETGVPDKPNS